MPIDQRLSTRISVTASAEPRWLRVPLKWNPARPENVVVIIGANDSVTLYQRQTQVPGVLALVHKPEADGDDNVAVDHAQAIIQWPAHPMRGQTVRARLSPPTNAYAPQKAVGGYQRPYGGPQLWVSKPTEFASPEWLSLQWDEHQTFSVIRLVFDDDVELNTLHHHRTPDEIFPELVRDYSIEAWRDGAWRELVSVSDNRRRHRVHILDEPVTTDRLRVVVRASNGVAQARVISVRVY